MKKTPDDPEKSRFSAVPVGSIKLLAEAGIEGNNNDGLCATGTTHMFKHGVQDKTIESQTGHTWVYERPSVEQHRETCEVLTNTTSTEGQLIRPPKPQPCSVPTTVYPCPI